MKLYKVETTDLKNRQNIVYLLYDKETNQRSITFTKIQDLSNLFYSTMHEDDTSFYRRIITHPKTKTTVIADIPSKLANTPLLVDFLQKEIPEEFL